jgi:hypothetical protein
MGDPDAAMSGVEGGKRKVGHASEGHAKSDTLPPNVLKVRVPKGEKFVPVRVAVRP